MAHQAPSALWPPYLMVLSFSLHCCSSLKTLCLSPLMTCNGSWHQSGPLPGSARPAFPLARGLLPHDGPSCLATDLFQPLLCLAHSYIPEEGGKERTRLWPAQQAGRARDQAACGTSHAKKATAITMLRAQAVSRGPGCSGATKGPRSGSGSSRLLQRGDQGSPVRVRVRFQQAVTFSFLLSNRSF